jgi:hypothetical protein
LRDLFLLWLLLSLDFYVSLLDKGVVREEVFMMRVMRQDYLFLSKVIDIRHVTWICLGFLRLVFYVMAVMVLMITFQLSLGLLDDLSHQILHVIHPEGGWNFLFWLLLRVELLIDVGNLINEGLIEVSHEHLSTRNLTGDVIRLLSCIGKLRIHRFKIGINLLIDLSNQIHNLALHLSELFLDVPLEWWGIVLDYFGESFLVALEFYNANDILQTANNLVMLFLLGIIGRKFF